jgi:hypothetical protein
MSLSPDEFQTRLEQISIHDGELYGRCRLIVEAEEIFIEAIQQFQGYIALSGAFKSFFLETIELLNSSSEQTKISCDLNSYRIFLMRLAQSYKSVCGAEKLAVHGYPLEAATILRNLFDNLVLTSAAIQNLTDFMSIEGVIPEVPPTEVSIKKLRIKTEREVQKKMIGKESGLSGSTIELLAKLRNVYNYEVHGSRMSMTDCLDWLRGEASLPIVTHFNSKNCGLFINRYCEVCWLIHRLVPNLQYKKMLLDMQWKSKWAIIDDSFSFLETAIAEECGKPMGDALKEFVKEKFPFNADSFFPL